MFCNASSRRVFCNASPRRMFCNASARRMFGWLVGWVAGRLVGGLVDWETVRLVGWQQGFGWSTGWWFIRAQPWVCWLLGLLNGKLMECWAGWWVGGRGGWSPPPPRPQVSRTVVDNATCGLPLPAPRPVAALLSAKIPDSREWRPPLFPGKLEENALETLKNGARSAPRQSGPWGHRPADGCTAVSFFAGTMLRHPAPFDPVQ
eukprot:gene6927-biopygen20951